MPKFPKFETIEEAAAWAETHDTAPYFDEMEDVPSFQFERPPQRVIHIRVPLDEGLSYRLKEIAKAKGLDYHELATKFIVERLAQEDKAA